MKLTTFSLLFVDSVFSSKSKQIPFLVSLLSLLLMLLFSFIRKTSLITLVATIPSPHRTILLLLLILLEFLKHSANIFLFIHFSCILPSRTHLGFLDSVCLSEKSQMNNQISG